MSTATSDVAICNLALQKLGAARITALSDNSRNARSMNAAYAEMRDREVARHPWNFAIIRVQLAASATPPVFSDDIGGTTTGTLNAYPLPSDCLRVLLPKRPWLDWRIEQNAGQPSILTADTAPLNLRYIQRVTDPTLFPTEFVDALACRLAWHCCEELTQSNEKKAAAAQEYKDSIAAARLNNAIQRIPEPGPEDTWVTARESSFDFVNWQRGAWTYG